MTENEIAKIVVDAALKVHTALGPGLLESVYETVLAYELEKRGLKVVRQVPMPVRYETIQFEEGFRADIIVEDSVIVELKSVEAVAAVQKTATHLPEAEQSSSGGSPHQFRSRSNQGQHHEGGQRPS